ncbi:MAG: hypothetical protein JXA33_29440 [Anaerolineae bacterium]|nr:hypothetical protein [Anaerolineae bacterium]
MAEIHFIEEMKRIGRLDKADQQLLLEMQPAIEQHASEIVNAFYAQLERFENLAAILHAEPGRVEKLKGHLTRWLVSLASKSYDETYYDLRYRIGKRHVEVGLEPRYVIAAMAFCRGITAQIIIETEYANDPRREARMIALNRAMDLDLNIMLQSYDDQRVQQFLEVTGFSKPLFEMLMTGG